MKLLRNVLQSTEYGFALDLAMLANRRQFLNLEKWLPDVIAGDQANVVSALTIKLDRGITGEGLAPVTIKQIMSVWCHYQLECSTDYVWLWSAMNFCP
jgi:hypothetical protein